MFISLSPIQQKMAKQLHHSQHLLLLVFFLSIINLSHQLQSSHSQTLLKLQQLLGYPSSLSTLTTTQDFCNIEPTPYLTLVCYEQNLTQLHLVGNTNNNNFTTSLPQNFNSHTLFSTLSTLSSLKVLSLVSLGLWGPLPETIGEFSSLEILNISSNYFSGEIPVHLSYLTNLQSLVLDDNNFNGEIPNLLSSLQGLVVLSMKKNFLTGNLPNSVNHLVTLRVLDLSNNQLFGELPHLHNLVNLQVLHLENNRLGPHFPSLPTKLVSLVLRNNSFRLGVPSNISSFYQLQELDLSLNGFVGPFPPSLLSLPSINYLDVSSNKFTGMLFENFSCNGDLRFVNLSSNLLKGELPSCLREKKKVVLYARNCLSNEKKQDQHSYSFCSSEALAVNISPRQQQKHKGTASKTVLVSSSIGVVGVLIVAVVVLVVNQVHKKNVSKTPSMATLEHVIISQMQNEDRVKTTARSIVEHIIRKVPDKNAMKTLTRFIKEHIASLLGNRRLSRSPSRSIIEHVSSVNTVKLLTDARCISETMKMGTGLPAYRTFSLEQLKEATNNFDESSLISEGPLGQIYKGVLSDGMQITIRGMKIRKKHSPQAYMHHVELISKLRHSHLVSSLGHSFECNQDDSSVNTIFLIFEFVQDKSLRSRISGSNGEKLCWTQRIAATIGVVKGIQYLHTGIVPGLYSNNIKITDILLDNNHNVKISSYNLPIYAENKRMVSNGTSHGVKGNLQARINDEDKNDVYDIGVILLEIILGRPIMFHNEVGTLKDLLHVSIKTDDIARRSIVDPFVHKECSDESLLKMMEICVRCLSSEPNERPSVEDILWNLQFAAQVQNSWRRETSDYRDSPKSSSRDTKLQ